MRPPLPTHWPRTQDKLRFQQQQRQQPELLCPCTLRGLFRLEGLIIRKFGSPDKYRAMAEAFLWPPQPSKECGQDGWEQLEAPCKCKPCKHLNALQQHADTQAGRTQTPIAEQVDKLINTYEEDDEETQPLQKLGHLALAEVRGRLPHPLLRRCPPAQPSLSVPPRRSGQSRIGPPHRSASPRCKAAVEHADLHQPRRPPRMRVGPF